jgi:hypothetical protein
MYAFLPIFLAVALFLGLLFIWHLRHQGLSKSWQQIRQDFIKLPMASKIILPLLVLLSVGLFGQSYGYNVVKFHTPVARCQRIYSLEDCLNYAPYRRDYESHRDLVAGKLQFQYSPNPISFTTNDWIRIMTFNMFFALNGEVSHFKVGNPLPLPQLLAELIGFFGLIFVVWYQKWLRQNYRLGFLLFVSLVYIAVLWFQEYSGFKFNGYAVAIQGRYLIPVILVLYLTVALAFARAVRRWLPAKAILAWLSIAVLLLQGGGAMVFIIRSDNYWYWPNATVQRVNHDAQKVLKTFVVGS